MFKAVCLSIISLCTLSQHTFAASSMKMQSYVCNEDGGVKTKAMLRYQSGKAVELKYNSGKAIMFSALPANISGGFLLKSKSRDAKGNRWEIDASPDGGAASMAAMSLALRLYGKNNAYAEIWCKPVK